MGSFFGRVWSFSCSRFRSSCTWTVKIDTWFFSFLALHRWFIILHILMEHWRACSSLQFIFLSFRTLIKGALWQIEIVFDRCDQFLSLTRNYSFLCISGSHGSFKLFLNCFRTLSCNYSLWNFFVESYSWFLSFNLVHFIHWGISIRKSSILLIAINPLLFFVFSKSLQTFVAFAGEICL